MTGLLEGITSSLLSKALDQTALEQKLIASNIANVDTVGYLPKTTRFSRTLEQLESRLADSSSMNSNELQQLVNDWVPENDIAIDHSQEKVEIDREMVNLTRNTLQYQALMTAKSGLSDLLRSAIKEGRA